MKNELRCMIAQVLRENLIKNKLVKCNDRDGYEFILADVVESAMKKFIRSEKGKIDHMALVCGIDIYKDLETEP